MNKVYKLVSVPSAAIVAVGSLFYLMTALAGLTRDVNLKDTSTIYRDVVWSPIPLEPDLEVVSDDEVEKVEFIRVPDNGLVPDFTRKIEVDVPITVAGVDAVDYSWLISTALKSSFAMTDRNYHEVYRPFVNYPHSALQNGITGYVVLSLTVSAAGRPLDVEIIEASSPRMFDKVAINNLKKFRFIPKVFNGIPVSTSGVRITYVFDGNVSTSW